jgi:hypothetical protein
MSNDKKWIQSAIEKPGSLKKKLGISGDEKIPVEKLKSLKKELQKKSEGDKKLSKSDLTLLKQVNLALNLRSLKEAPIDYGDSPERMDPDIERKLASSETPLSGNIAFPKLRAGLKTSNFEELIASKRFKDVVAKVKHYTGVNNVSGNAFRQLMMSMMQSFQKIVQIESRNKEYLENLAIDMVKKEFEIPEGAINFDVKLVGLGEMDTSKFKTKSEDPSQEDIEDTFQMNIEDEMEDFMTSMEQFQLEKSKRRFINALIQGASKKGHYMFELVKDELDNIDPTLLRLYGVTMSVNDMLYWMFSDDMMSSMLGGGGGGGMAGSEEVDIQTDPPTIKVRAAMFPVLVHELIKGVHELIATHGQPDDPAQAEMVMATTDTLENEFWDLRLGPILWEKLQESLPDEIFEEGQRTIQAAVLQKFYGLSAKEFHVIAHKIMKGSAEGKKFISDLVADIKNKMTKDQFGDLFNDDEDDMDDDDLSV